MTTLRGKILAAALCFLPTAAFAGAGANITACIYMPAKPTTAWKASFIAGGNGTHCMSSNGSNATVQVQNQGLNCGSVGYVEEKGSSSGGDTCSTDTSHWVLSYTSTDTNGAQLAYTGSTSVEMERDMTHNHAGISNQTTGTQICTSQALCTSTGQDWDHGSQGPLFIVYQPLAQPSNN